MIVEWIIVRASHFSFCVPDGRKQKKAGFLAQLYSPKGSVVLQSIVVAPVRVLDPKPTPASETSSFKHSETYAYV